ncbi:MAG: DUF1512 family protein [Candidatus Aenigmarchaeota archaeon]|nr:DUF1512 domain-containing protein [Candidatus Aenigmarchaeota archaeon]MDW8149731.1 DUF1512 family protein [Candidatus Aenigmarchaeota archaeon]
MAQNVELIQTIVWLIFLGLVFVNFLFPDLQIRLQLIQFLSKIETIRSSIRKIKKRCEEEVKKTIVKKDKIDREKLSEFIKNMMEYHIIHPVSLDPSGIVEKIEHVLNISETDIKKRALLFYKDYDKRDNFVTSIVAMGEIHKIDKFITHYIELIKKTKSVPLAFQLSTLMPLLQEISKSLYSISISSINNLPIGDSIGPLIALNLIKESKAKTIEILKKEECVLLKGKLNNKKIYILKARGFGSRVGRIGRAIEYTIKKYKIKNLITIDAAQKLEGEKSGAIAEGVGVAIGGIGIDSVFVENIALKNKVNLYSLLIKMSILEALGPLNKTIYNSAKDVIEKIKLKIKNTEGSFLIVGVGNTCGIGNIAKDLKESEKKIKKSFKEFEKLRKLTFS